MGGRARSPPIRGSERRTEWQVLPARKHRFVKDCGAGAHLLQRYVHTAAVEALPSGATAEGRQGYRTLQKGILQKHTTEMRPPVDPPLCQARHLPAGVKKTKTAPLGQAWCRHTATGCGDSSSQKRDVPRVPQYIPSSGPCSCAYLSPPDTGVTSLRDLSAGLCRRISSTKWTGIIVTGIQQRFVIDLSPLLHTTAGARLQPNSVRSTC